MKKFIIQFVLLILIIAGSLVFFNPTGSGSLDLPFLPQRSAFATLEINGGKIKVEIADTVSKRSKGLGGKETLASDQGMLFIFPKADKYPFWMRGVKMPLDFVWIKGDQVVDVLADVPPPAEGQTDAALPIYQSNVEIDKVLEVNAGVVQKLGIKVGDSVKLFR